MVDSNDSGKETILNKYDMLCSDYLSMLDMNRQSNEQLVTSIKLLERYRLERVDIQQQAHKREQELLERLAKQEARFSSLKKEISKVSQKVYQLEKENRHLRKELSRTSGLYSCQSSSGVSSLSSFAIQEESMLDDNESSGDELAFDKSDDFLDAETSAVLIPKSMTPSSNQVSHSQAPESKNTPVAVKPSDLVQTDSTPVQSPNVISSQNAETLTPTSPKPNNFDTSTPNETSLISQGKSKPLSRLSLLPASSSAPNRFRLSKPKIGQNLLESRRKHEFQVKKAFKPITCCVCNKSVYFCSKYSVCVNCKSATHTYCQSTLDTICTFGAGDSASTPGSRKSITRDGRRASFKSSQFTVIGDFIMMKQRPFIPAFLIKCCEELERRIAAAESKQSVAKLVEKVYGKSSQQKLYDSLLTRLIRSKSGIPSLEKEDTSVIGSVVLAFLNNLSEPLITNVLSRDFATAVTTNDLAQIQLLERCLAQMPGPNQDSLAFIILHLYKLIDMAKEGNDSDQVKAYLIHIFSTPIASYFEFSATSTENGKTMSKRIMAALFDLLPRSVWTDILTI